MRGLNIKVTVVLLCQLQGFALKNNRNKQNRDEQDQTITERIVLGESRLLLTTNQPVAEFVNLIRKERSNVVNR
jgi:hypothetical protein